MTNYNILVGEGDIVSIDAEAGISLAVDGDSTSISVLGIVEPTQPALSENLIKNMYFADNVNGPCKQCGIFDYWDQLHGTWRKSQVKSAEQHTMPAGTTTATEWDRDRSADGTWNGWDIGQSDEMWQVVTPTQPYTYIVFAFHAIHHVYGGDCIIGVDALDSNGMWQRLTSWQLSTSDMPPASRYERIWRKVAVGTPAPQFTPVALRLHMWAELRDLRDGMKISGMELRVGT